MSNIECKSSDIRPEKAPATYEEAKSGIVNFLETHQGKCSIDQKDHDYMIECVAFLLPGVNSARCDGHCLLIDNDPEEARDILIRMSKSVYMQGRFLFKHIKAALEFA